MKSTLLQAGIIVGASVIVALGYNWFSADPLPLVREEKVLQTADDAALFEDGPGTPPHVDTIGLNPAQQDTPLVVPNVADNTKEVDIAKRRENVPPAQRTGSDVTTPDGAAQPATAQPSTARADEQADEQKATAKNVTYDQVARLARDPAVLFIDARNAEEYSQGHIGNARNYYTPEFEQHIPEILQIDRNTRIVVYCGGGACELSHEMADHLINFGFKRVFVYTGGWSEWLKKQGGN